MTRTATSSKPASRPARLARCAVRDRPPATPGHPAPRLRGMPVRHRPATIRLHPAITRRRVTTATAPIMDLDRTGVGDAVTGGAGKQRHAKPRSEIQFQDRGVDPLEAVKTRAW